MDYYLPAYDFPKTDIVPKIKICLFFVPRSGSNYLAQLMRNSGIGFPLEYFSSVHAVQDKNVWVKRRTAPNGVFSYKWNCNFGPIPKPIYPGFGVFLDRKDKTAQAKSYYWAEQTGGWFGSMRDKPDVSLSKLNPVINKLQKMRVRTEKMVAKAGLNHIRIFYEDLVTDPDKWVKMIKRRGLEHGDSRRLCNA